MTGLAARTVTRALAPIGDLARGIATGEADAVAALVRAHDRRAADVLVLGLEPVVAPAGPRPEIGLDAFTVAVGRHRLVPEWDLLAVAALTRDHPYNLARRTLAAWHLSGGRIGTILVADADAPRDGRDEWLHPPASSDEARLADAAAALRALWRSWPAGSIVGDRDTGVYARTDSIRPVDHRGVYRIAGPLTTPAAALREPVLASWEAEAARPGPARSAEPAWSDLSLGPARIRRRGDDIGEVLVVATAADLDSVCPKTPGARLCDVSRALAGAAS